MPNGRNCLDFGVENRVRLAAEGISPRCVLPTASVLTGSEKSSFIDADTDVPSERYSLIFLVCETRSLFF